MKQRVISGAIIAAISIAVILLGGGLFTLTCIFIAAQGCKEYISIRKGGFSFSLYIIMFLSVDALFFLHDYTITIMALEIIALMSIAVFDEEENYLDLCGIFLISQLMGNSLYFMVFVENYSKWLMGYLTIISYITDVFALFTGMKFGKHKLNERISPKKTTEGAIGGWICGAIFSIIWAYIFKFFYFEPWIIILLSILLPIVSQVGDLIFSMIKRYYNVKDFSNLIPGHGGILDRFDSLLFNVLFFGAMISIVI